MKASAYVPLYSQEGAIVAGTIVAPSAAVADNARDDLLPIYNIIISLLLPMTSLSLSLSDYLCTG